MSAREDLDALRRPGRPTQVRGFIQINLIRPSVQAVLDKLTNVPVDIAPRFTAIR